MAIFEKINPKKSFSLLLFYVAMALSIVYFDLFQSIEGSSINNPAIENIELVPEQANTTNSSNFELTPDLFVLQKTIKTTQKDANHFQKRLFHDNQNLAHQFKEIVKKQFLIPCKSHLQIALIISHQKMEEEENKHLV